MRRARAQFSAGFFGCAGYRITDNNGFASVEEGVKAAASSKADIIVVCSSDDEYASFIPGICKELKGKSLIVVAGNPASADDLKNHGVDSFIHIKSNVIGMLSYFNRKLGICNRFE
jgi:methylmalonyl-CoA mutase